MKIDVINIHKYDGIDYIKIDRSSPYGNPYSSKEKSLGIKVSNRTIAIEKYKEYIKENIHLVDQLIEELKTSGYSKLGCHCKPKPCHGDVLSRLIYERTTGITF